ncbi:MAG: osmotically inducible protein C [Marinilabiliales bacterium]|nr:MAG: osmotically inducible protein C [Marinilabiliales bacterium]
MKVYFPGGKKVYMDTGKFIIETDQNKNDGGEESAPEPFTLFLASIGTCAGIYIKKFCDIRNIPTNQIDLHQSIEYDQVARRINAVKLKIDLPEDFPEKYKNAIIKAADQCAVKKYLQEPFEVKIETKYDGE